MEKEAEKKDRKEQRKGAAEQKGTEQSWAVERAGWSSTEKRTRTEERRETSIVKWKPERTADISKKKFPGTVRPSSPTFHTSSITAFTSFCTRTVFQCTKTFLELNVPTCTTFAAFVLESRCGWINQYPISVKRHASVWRHVSARTPPALGQQLTIAANFGRGWNPAEAGRRSVLQTSTLPSAAAPKRCRRESRESTTGAERGGAAARGCEWSKRLTAVVVEGWLWWKKDSLSIFASVVAVRMCYLCVRFRLFADCIVCCLPFINFLVVLFPPSSLCSVFTFPLSSFRGLLFSPFSFFLGLLFSPLWSFLGVLFLPLWAKLRNHFNKTLLFTMFRAC